MVDRGDEAAPNSLPIVGVGSSPRSMQVHALGERQPAHQLVDRIAADEDLVRLDAGDRRAPRRLVAAPAWRRLPGTGGLVSGVPR